MKPWETDEVPDLSKLHLPPSDSSINITLNVRDETLRDYFAGQALAGLLAGMKDDYFGKGPSADRVADYAMYLADAMIRAREETS
jgi:hypothetical protein